MKSGKANELDIISALNGYYFKDLNPMWQHYVKRIFPKITDNDTIRAYLYWDNRAKPDMVLICNQVRKFVSIKSGHNPTCHHETLSSFITFLRKNKIPERYIRIILFYHYGRSDKLSNNGQSFTRKEIIDQYGDYLADLNNYLETRTDITEKLIYRTIIRGLRPNVDLVDFFYYGSVNNGFLLSRQDVYNEIINDNDKDPRGAPHFGGLLYQARTRQDDNPERSCVRIMWPILCLNFYNKEFLKKYSYVPIEAKEEE